MRKSASMEVIAVGTAAIDVVHEVATYPEGPLQRLAMRMEAITDCSWYHRGLQGAVIGDLQVPRWKRCECIGN